MIAYLSEHPERRGLMFFGNGHLIRSRVRKDNSGILTPEESEGMYLGHYLKRRLGDGRVFTIAQVGRTRSRLDLSQFAGRDVMFPSSDAPWKASPPGDNDLVPENFDAFIVRDGFIVQAHPLGYVFSRRVVNAAIERLAFAEPHRSGAMGSRLFNQAMSTLVLLSDTSFSTPEEWRSWFSVRPVDGLKRLRSPEFRQRFEARSSGALGTPEFGRYVDELIDLGFDPRVGSPGMSREEWRQYLDDQWPQIVCLNAIGILSVGEQAEKAEAKEYLIGMSGSDFRQPGEYLKWWRARFYNVTY